jgi:hypothetical protein
MYHGLLDGLEEREGEECSTPTSTPTGEWLRPNHL